ncbi:hypothetical protein PR048_011934, partial [Dryococelus australis]
MVVQNHDVRRFWLSFAAMVIYTYFKCTFWQPRSNYTDSLSTTRCCIERCNGVLKARFRCLRKSYITSPQLQLS